MATLTDATSYKAGPFRLVLALVAAPRVAQDHVVPRLYTVPQWLMMRSLLVVLHVTLLLLSCYAESDTLSQPPAAVVSLKALRPVQTQVGPCGRAFKEMAFAAKLA